MRRARLPGLLCLLLTWSCGPAGEPAASLHVSAAASLRELVQDLEASWARPRGVELVLNVAGSSTLARQIEAGARCDLFLAADGASIERAGLDPARRVPFASNRLALVVSAGADAALLEPRDLAQHVRHLALAGPSVPAGAYARELLTALGALEALAGRIVDADDVRGALGLVEAGAVDAALVYATDAALVRRAQVRWRADVGAPPRIELFAGLPEAAGAPAPLARELLEWLGGPEFRALAEARGFGPPLTAGDAR